MKRSMSSSRSSTTYACMAVQFFQGLPNVGGTKKITQMLICAANAAQKKDQEFVQDLRSMTLMRDERRTPKLSKRIPPILNDFFVFQTALSLAKPSPYLA